jgi:hypothetical protein
MNHGQTLADDKEPPNKAVSPWMAIIEAEFADANQ